MKKSKWKHIDNVYPNDKQTVLIYNDASKYQTSQVITVLYIDGEFKEINFDKEGPFETRRGAFFPHWWRPVPKFKLPF